MKRAALRSKRYSLCTLNLNWLWRFVQRWSNRDQYSFRVWSDSSWRDWPDCHKIHPIQNPPSPEDGDYGGSLTIQHGRVAFDSKSWQDEEDKKFFSPFTSMSNRTDKQAVGRILWRTICAKSCAYTFIFYLFIFDLSFERPHFVFAFLCVVYCSDLDVL